MSKAAVRYAKAVLDIAVEQGQEKEVFNQMRTIASTLSENTELQLFLNNLVVTPDNKKSVLLEVFPNTSSIVTRLFDLIIENKRTGLLHSIATTFVQLYHRHINAVEAVVTTAIPLDTTLENQVLNKVKELTQASEVTLHNQVDPEIIGGFILRVGDWQYDASIANHFDSLKKRFNTSI